MSADYPYPARIEIQSGDDIGEATLVDYWGCPSLTACGRGDPNAEDLLVLLFAVDGPKAQRGQIYFHLHLDGESGRDEWMLRNFLDVLCPGGGDLNNRNLRGRRVRVKLGWFGTSRARSRIVGFLWPGETKFRSYY